MNELAGDWYLPSDSALSEEIFPELHESEDEKVRKEIMQLIQGMHDADPRKERWLAWFEKQNLIMAKSPQLGEQKSAWSEEDELKRSTLIHVVEKLQGSAIFEGLLPEELIAWLKSLKDRVQPQPKQEWSEEDKKRIQRISDFIWKNRKGDTDDIYQQEQDVKWLKSLRLQKQWKPSEKQMEALKEACDEHWEPDGLDPLYTLYQELKKLRKE